MIRATRSGGGRFVLCVVVPAMVALAGCGGGSGSTQYGGLTVQGTASRPAGGATQLSQADLAPTQLPESHVPMVGPSRFQSR